MGYPLRQIPHGGATVEITTRTVQGRFLLRPTPEVNRIVTGVIGRAQRLYRVEVFDVRVMSNHLHLLIFVETGRQMADFMRHVKSNIARKIGRLHDWSGPFWAGRYASIQVWTDECDQIARLRYLLEQGCKEGLVASPRDWPGLHGTHALLTGEPIAGVWINRTRWHRGPVADRADPSLFREAEAIVLSPLHCWRHLPPEVYRRRIEQMVREIERETRKRHQRDGTRPLGAARISAAHPHQRPETLKRSPKPRFHCASKAARKLLDDAYADFCRAFRAAADRLKAGDPAAVFPEGAFPPSAPFVEPIRGPA